MAKIDAKLYTLEDLMETVRVSKVTLYSYIKAGKLNAFKIGRRWYLSESEMRRFLRMDEAKE